MTLSFLISALLTVSYVQEATSVGEVFILLPEIPYHIPRRVSSLSSFIASFLIEVMVASCSHCPQRARSAFKAVGAGYIMNSSGQTF